VSEWMSGWMAVPSGMIPDWNPDCLILYPAFKYLCIGIVLPEGVDGIVSLV